MNDAKFKGLAKTLDIYVGNVVMESSSDDISDYVANELEINVVNCEELKSQYVRNTKSFKLTVAAGDREQLLHPNLWPESVTVRKFYSSRSRS